MPGYSKDSLFKVIPGWLKAKGGVSNVEVGGEDIVAELNEFNFDYKKHGFTMMGTSMFLSKPVSGDITISLKDEKYRVIIKNMVSNKKQKSESLAKTSSAWDGFGDNMTFNNMLLKSNKSDWRKVSGSGGKQLSSFESDLYDSFIYDPAKTSSNW